MKFQNPSSFEKQLEHIHVSCPILLTKIYKDARTRVKNSKLNGLEKFAKTVENDSLQTAVIVSSTKPISVEKCQSIKKIIMCLQSI